MFSVGEKKKRREGWCCAKKGIRNRGRKQNPSALFFLSLRGFWWGERGRREGERQKGKVVAVVVVDCLEKRKKKTQKGDPFSWLARCLVFYFFFSIGEREKKDASG